MAGNLPSYDSLPHPVDPVGSAFAVGAAGGGAFHFVRGLIRGGGSPGIIADRLVPALRAAGANAPRVAGACGACCVAASAIEYAVSCAQGVDESLSGAFVGGATVCATIGMRRGGVPAAARYLLYWAAGVLAAAEINRKDNMIHGELCFWKNRVKQLRAIAARAKLDAERGEYTNRRPLCLRMSPFTTRDNGQAIVRRETMAWNRSVRGLTSDTRGKRPHPP